MYLNSDSGCLGNSFQTKYVAEILSLCFGLKVVGAPEKGVVRQLWACCPLSPSPHCQQSLFCLECLLLSLNSYVCCTGSAEDSREVPQWSSTVSNPLDSHPDFWRTPLRTHILGPIILMAQWIKVVSVQAWWPELQHAHVHVHTHIRTRTCTHTHTYAHVQKERLIIIQYNNMTFLQGF